MDEAAQSQAMRVDSRLVREQLVGSLLAAAMQKANDPTAAPPNDLNEALRAVRGDEQEPRVEAQELGARVARLGYACRDAETEMFEPARRSVSWLAERVEKQAGIDVATELARSEPELRPDPGDSPSWEVPGPGGHVRHYAAIDGIQQLVSDDAGPGELPEGATPLELKRCWMLGFFLRCCEDAGRG